MYLLETNVISEMRKVDAGKADHRVTDWASGIPLPLLYLSVISILELERGALLMERRDVLQGAGLRGWLRNQVLHNFEGRILVVDSHVAQRCAAMQMPDPRSYRDSLIAATGAVHGMTVVTRNVHDFERTGVALLNPWEA
jgi:predicted nucleic acid-binding protein